MAWLSINSLSVWMWTSTYWSSCCHTGTWSSRRNRCWTCSASLVPWSQLNWKIDLIKKTRRSNCNFVKQECRYKRILTFYCFGVWRICDLFCVVPSLLISLLPFRLVTASNSCNRVIFYLRKFVIAPGPRDLTIISNRKLGNDEEEREPRWLLCFDFKVY